MVQVFAEIRRVLKPEGTLWLNLGDSYAGSGKGLNGDGSLGVINSAKQRSNAGSLFADGSSLTSRHGLGSQDGCKPKDLIGIPWRVAFALQEAGWWLRQDIIWHKPNPMPESVTDRCTKSHEYIFLLTKSPRYYFDQDAIREPLKDASVARLIQDVESQNGSDRVPGKTNGAMKAVAGKGRDRSNGNRNGLGASTLDKKAFTPDQAGGGGINNRNRSGYFDRDTGEAMCGITANKKSVWTVTTQPFKDAHFATFPPKLIEPCILAGSKEGDLVLDPFSGAGTTGLVSLRHKRNFVGIELNPDYIKIAEKRLAEVQVKLFA